MVSMLLLGLAACARDFGALRQPTVTEATLQQSAVMDEIEAMLDLGDYRAAEARLAEALGTGFHHPRAYLLRGRLALGQGGKQRAEAAIPWFERAVEASPGWFAARTALGQTYLEAQRYAAADAVFAELDRLYPEHPVGPYGRGVIAETRGSEEAAAQFLDQALQRDGAFAPALRARAYLASQQGDAQAHRRLLERYLAARPGDAEAHLELGGVLEAAGRLEDARRSFERSWKLFPSKRTARRLAELARRRGRPQAAAQWEQRAE
ncbi:MAG: tetratricopeptide repeat protein [Planctomycetota bacterium]